MKFETFVTWLDSIVKQAEFLDLQPKVTKSVPSRRLPSWGESRLGHRAIFTPKLLI